MRENLMADRNRSAGNQTEKKSLVLVRIDPDGETFLLLPELFECQLWIRATLDMQGREADAEGVRARALPRPDIDDLGPLELEAVALEVSEDGGCLQIDASGRLGVGVA